MSAAPYRRRVLEVACLLGIAGHVGAQGAVPLPTDVLIPVAQLREDTRIARMALVQSQVGRTWFQSERAFTTGFDALDRGLVAPLTRRDFHRRLAPLVAAIGHGHVTLERPVPGIGFRTRLLDSTGHYLPLALRIVDRSAYVTADLSDVPHTLRGAELVAVDGMPVVALLDEMQLFVSADGRNASFKRYQLGTNWRFHELLDLLHGPRLASRITVRPASSAGAAVATESFVVTHATPRELHTRHETRVGTPIDLFPPAVGLRFAGIRTGLLTVSAFYEGLLPKDMGSFDAAFERAFKTIADSGVTDLVIDVRGNEGGNGEYPALLYSFLASRPFRLDGRTVVASDTLSWLRYAPDAGDDVKAFAVSPRDFLDRAVDGLWLLKPELDSTRVRTYQPRDGRFTGRLYIMTDGGSFSATNAFVMLAATEHASGGRRVLFVGEENGGDNAAGHVSGGVQQTLVLPSTGERLTISLTGVVPRISSKPVRVRVPDVRVQPRGDAIAVGRDPVFDKVQSMIADARTNSTRRKR